MERVEGCAYMVYVEDVLVRWESQVQRGGRCDLEEAVGLQEGREGGHEGGAVPPGDVHRVGGAADEPIAFSRQRGETLALRLGDLVECGHANGQPDIRRSSVCVCQTKKKSRRRINDYTVAERGGYKGRSERTPTCRSIIKKKKKRHAVSGSGRG